MLHSVWQQQQQQQQQQRWQCWTGSCSSSGGVALQRQQMGTRWSFYWTLMLLGVQALQAACMTRVLLRGC
jgi:hypothetical protein